MRKLFILSFLMINLLGYSSYAQERVKEVNILVDPADPINMTQLLEQLKNQTNVEINYQAEDLEDIIVDSINLQQLTLDESLKRIENLYPVNFEEFQGVLYATYNHDFGYNIDSDEDLFLEDDVISLQSIAVVGYQNQKVENLSGAVDNLNLEEVNNRPISNLSQGLQGVSPNLNVDFNSGAPGQTARINIRGFTSINGGDPLILIDNIPSSTEDLRMIAPEDVANITVLKDASSAAIYGARAAFGVVLITTKSGKGKGLQINYNMNYAVGSPTVMPNKITDPYIHMRLLETSTDNTPWDNVNFSEYQYQWAKERSDNPNSSGGVRESTLNPGAWEYMGNKDWTKYFLADNSSTVNHSLSIGGSAERVQYYLFGSYNHDNGSLKLGKDNFSRYGFRGKINIELNDWLSIGNNSFISNTLREKPSYLDMMRLYTFFPTDWDKNPDGTWANTDVGREAAQLDGGGEYVDEYNSVQSKFDVEIKVIPSILKVNSDYTIKKGSSLTEVDYKKYFIGFGPDDIREEGVNQAEVYTMNDTYEIFNLYGTLTKKWGSHDVTGILGFNQENYKINNVSISRDGVISPELPTIQLATGTPSVYQDIRDWAVRGAFYRLGYIYDQRYILELNGRYDGSSRFPKEKRFGFFPSASVAWNVSNEEFLKDYVFINNLKIRASYGTLGNQYVTEYGYIPTLSAVEGNYIFGDKKPQRMLSPSLVSPNYTWEEVTSQNLGFDLGLFNNKITAGFDIYRRDTKGMLTLGRDLPGVLGATEPKENAADLKTVGWELALGFNKTFLLSNDDFSLSAKFILSDNKSHITRFDNPRGLLTQYYVGQELGEIWGLESDGLFQTEEEMAQLDESALIPWGAIQIAQGWPKFVDQDGNGAIEVGTNIDDPKDLKVIGNSTPRYRYGFNFDFEWKGFDASLFFQGVGKRDYYPLDYLYWGYYQQPYAGGYTHLYDFYRATDDAPDRMAMHSKSYIDAGLANQNHNAYYPILQSWLADRNLGERIDQAKGLALPQTRYLLDASYLRMKNITIGYTFSTKWVESIGISSARIYFSGENLLEWSAVTDYFDPEAISDSYENLDPSVSKSRTTGKGFQYPFQRKFSIGLNVKF